MNKELQHIDLRLKQMAIVITGLITSAFVLSLLLLFSVAASIDEDRMYKKETLKLELQGRSQIY